MHVEVDLVANTIYMFTTDFATYVYSDTVIGSGGGTTTMGSTGRLTFGCLTSPAAQLFNNLVCHCANLVRPIFAPFSRKIAPYDTLLYHFRGIKI